MCAFMVFKTVNCESLAPLLAGFTSITWKMIHLLSSSPSSEVNSFIARHFKSANGTCSWRESKFFVYMNKYWWATFQNNKGLLVWVFYSSHLLRIACCCSGLSDGHQWCIRVMNTPYQGCLWMKQLFRIPCGKSHCRLIFKTGSSYQYLSRNPCPLSSIPTQ